MAGRVNRALIIGHLGKDPEMRNDGKIATFSVATTDTWNDHSSGERRERTTWHSIVVFNQALAEISERYLKRGSHVCVEGSIESRDYTDKEGIKRAVTEIVIRPFHGSITMLDKAERPEGRQRRDARPEPGGRR